MWRGVALARSCFRISALSVAIVEGDQPAQHRRVLWRRDGFIADDPRIKLGIGDFDQPLELVERGVIEGVDAGIGETADDQIHFAHAAAPGAKQQPAPPLVQSCTGTLGHSCRSYLFWSMIFSEKTASTFLDHAQRLKPGRGRAKGI